MNSIRLPDIRMFPNEFPMEALPPKIRAAVQAVSYQVQASPGLVASVAFSALSMAGQGSINVCRPGMSPSPASLSILVLADSGHRKTSVYSKLYKVIEQHENQLVNLDAQRIRDQEVAFELWKADNDDLRKALRKERGTEFEDDIRVKLEAHLKAKPQAIAVRKMLYRDTTMQALLDGMTRGGNLVGLVSHEGGIIFNSPVLNDQGSLNTAWDGQALSVTRKTMPEARVENPRLTILALVQPGIFWDFIERDAGKSRHSGLLARFLVCAPYTDVGYRFEGPLPEYEVNEIAQHLREFEIALQKLLLESYPLEGCAEFKTVTFDQDSQAIWYEMINQFEADNRPGRPFEHFIDFGSKLGDNLARLAALLVYFETGSLIISAEYLRRAHHILCWYINEYLWLFRLDKPLSETDALQNRLYNWLLKNSHNGLYPLSRITQYAGSPFKTRAKRNRILLGLVHQRRILIKRWGSKKFVFIIKYNMPQWIFHLEDVVLD